MNGPPEGQPTYRVLTGPDDAVFCKGVSDLVAMGYRLYGPPTATFNGGKVVVVQALIWPSIEAAIAR
jgi:hypothetical protein